MGREKKRKKKKKKKVSKQIIYQMKEVKECIVETLWMDSSSRQMTRPVRDLSLAGWGVLLLIAAKLSSKLEWEKAESSNLDNECQS